MSEGNGADSIGMTIKQMVIELYGDMKVVRPAVESLQDASLPARVAALELTAAQLKAIAPVTAEDLGIQKMRVDALWAEHLAAAAVSSFQSRLGYMARIAIGVMAGLVGAAVPVYLAIHRGL